MGRYHTGSGFLHFLAASAAHATGLAAVRAAGGAVGHSRAFLCFIRECSGLLTLLRVPCSFLTDLAISTLV